MKIDGDTITFKAWPFYYEAVVANRKTAEVRLLDSKEVRALYAPGAEFRYVRIVNTRDESQEVTRELSGVFEVGRLLGSELHMFCWRVPA